MTGISWGCDAVAMGSLVGMDTVAVVVVVEVIVGTPLAFAHTVIPLDLCFELGELLQLDLEYPLRVAAHLPFHPVDLPKTQPPLSNYTSRLVGEHVIVDDLRRDCEGEDE